MGPFHLRMSAARRRRHCDALGLRKFAEAESKWGPTVYDPVLRSVRAGSGDHADVILSVTFQRRKVGT